MSGILPAALGKYEVRGTLGKGAMGTVYDGWDPVIHRRVAIKTVRLPDANDEEAIDGLARFKREAQAAGRLTHPNIVGVFDYGETDAVAYIVMEFVEGRSLKERLGANERMAAATATALMEDVLAGLTYSHGRGVVHRDIKPANIMITLEDRAKIADFGIARIEASSMTQAGTVMGTPAYMSPEQFMGQVVDSRTDIYSCGVMLYQLLTGERPFEGSMTAIMHKALSTVPPRPSDLAVTAPANLDGVVAKAMARRPEDRFETAAAFAQALRTPPALDVPASDETIVSAPRPAAVAAPMLTTPAPAVGQTEPARPPPRSKLPILMAAGVGVVGIAGGGLWFLTSGHDAPAPTGQVAQIAAPAPVIAPLPVPAPSPVQPALAVPAGEPAAKLGPTSSPPIAVVPQDPAALLVAPPATGQLRSPAMVEAALASALPAVSCSLVRVITGADGAVTVSGVAGNGAPEDVLRRAIADAAPTKLTWQVQAFDGPYCTALDAVRPFADLLAKNRNAMDLSQADGPASLIDNQVIALQVTMPGFAGYLHVAYLQHDATVAPQLPGPGYPSQTYPARARIELGKPRPDFEGWHVGPPFGTDMIVAVASTAPLFARPLPASQPLASYVLALQTAMDSLRRRGGSVAAASIVLDTRPGH